MPRWIVDFLVEFIVHILLQIVAARLNNEDIIIDWEDPVQVRDWLNAAKRDTEAVLVESGVSQALDQAKNAARRAELAVTFLRAMSACKRRHDRWVQFGGKKQKERRGFRAAPAAERQQQLDEILEQARELDSFDLPPDPNHLGSWRHPILSKSFAVWFMERKDGTDIVQASNALGRTKESHEAALKNQQALVDFNKTHKKVVFVDHLAINRKNLVEAAMATSGSGPYPYDDVGKGWRTGSCTGCGMFVIAGHNAAYHRCSSDTPPLKLTGGNFRDIERTLYVHDILRNPQMAAALGDMTDVLAELRLVAVPVQPILDAQRSALQQLLQPQDWSAISPVLVADGVVFVPDDASTDSDHLLTLAVDVVLATKSTCPDAFIPPDFASRNAWNQTQSGLLQDWFVSRTCSGTVHRISWLIYWQPLGTSTY